MDTPRNTQSGLTPCKKHNQPILYIYTLPNSSYPTLICDKCKNEIGENVFNVIKVNVCTISEFFNTQNPNSENFIRNDILKSLTEKNVKLKEINQNNDEQIKNLEKDFAVSFRNYHTAAEMAKKYLREKIEGDFKKLAERYKSLVSNYKILEQKYPQPAPTTPNSATIFSSPRNDDYSLDVEGNNIEEVIFKIIKKNAPFNQLKYDCSNFSLEVEKLLNSGVSYRKNENSTKYFQEINKDFDKMIKEYFRKFKRFLENSGGALLNTTASAPDLTKDSMYGDFSMRNLDISRIGTRNPSPNNNSSIDLNKSSDSILNALSPRPLRKNRSIKLLSEFPKITNPEIESSLKKYGNFNVIIENSSYKGVPEIGAVLLEDNSIYKGQWKEDKRHGRGQCITVEGSFIDGYWTNDVPDFLCRIIHQNGDIYEGYVKDGMASGKGVFIAKTGYRYVGNWICNIKSGTGEELCEDGSEYKGEFLNDKRHGKGELTFKSGGKYTGMFCDGQIEGMGICIWREGVKYEGYWSANKRNGKGKYYFKNGDEYHGDFVNDVPHGFGKLVKQDGKILTGCWKNGVVSGLMGYKLNNESSVVEVKTDGSIMELKEWGN